MIVRRHGRSKRNRLWQLGIFFLIYTCYTCYHALSATTENPLSSDSVTSYTEETVSAKSEYSTNNPDETSQSDDRELNATKPSYSNHNTWRKRRDNCTPPAIEQFPPPLMPASWRKHGGLVVHVLVAVFTFIGLAVVCDDYFVSSLDRICESLKLSPDVAGATFMAAGSSAPELATVIIGVFFAQDDIGVSGVIGSAVFNIMFVISVCALCSGTVSQLNWWPLVRDCTFYSISILIMLIVIWNDIISWPEALVMLLFYVVYCVALHFNSSLEKWAEPYILKLPIKLPTREEQSALVSFKNIPEPSYTQPKVEEAGMSPNEVAQPAAPEYNPYNDPNNSWDPNAAWTDTNSAPSAAAVPVTKNWNMPATDNWGNQSGSGTENYGYNQTESGFDPSAGGQNQAQNVNAINSPTTVQQVNNETDYYKPREPRPQDLTNPLIKPQNADTITTIAWAIVYPIHYMCRLTMVDVKQEKYKNYYPLTFMISMIWISFYSYFMVWMITIIGFSLGIPDTVMGLTFVAAGVSVPDALSSIAVIKEGYGDMAVSNAVGSNVFDILICLGLPWFIQTAIIKPGSHVNVISKGLAYSTLSLLSTVVFLLFAIHMNSWKLDKKLGIILMFWYLFFITIAALYELNVFGYMNPPECVSSF